MTITFKHIGNFEKTFKFLNRAKQLEVKHILNKYGIKGVSALAAATPKDTGLTASSWNYYISVTKLGCKLYWTNDNYEFGAPVAILLQYGHGTPNGTYVEGIDYINPAIKSILEELAEDLYKEVSNL